MHQTVNLAASAYGGSNPSLPNEAWCGSDGQGRAGVTQLVEFQPSKLDVAGSNPVARCEKGTESAAIAQR